MSDRGRLYEVLLAQGRKRPNSPALTFLDSRLGTITYSYGRLFEEASQIGRRLSSVIERGGPLGILVRSQESQSLHYLAALSAGLTPAILTPPNRKLHAEYYAQTTSAVIDRCGFAAVVTDVEGLEVAAPTLAPFTLVPSSRTAARPSSLATAVDGASFLQFSSGTTGIKRGVLVSDKAALSQINVYAEAIELDERDLVLGWLPLYHDMGFVACLNMPLARGVHSVMIDPIDWVTEPGLFLRAASRFRASLAWNPNFAFAFMAQRVRERGLSDLDLSSLRGLANCSEPVTWESQQQFADRFSRYGLREEVFWGCYAMAETTFAVTHGTPADADYCDPTGPIEGGRTSGSGYVSVGRPLPGVTINVADDEGRSLPDRRIGEIWVTSPFTFSGYYNDPAATSAAFTDSWYHTGDLGYRVGEALYVVGRKKDVLISGGVNLFPGDIEEVVSSVQGVAPGRVSAFSLFDPSAQTDRIVILFEAPSDDGPDPIVEIRQRVLAAFQISTFTVHRVPRAWLVKSTSGKMARAANRAKWSDESTAEEERRRSSALGR